MKKIISISVALFMVVALDAQTNAVDEFFDKYSERDGFTIVTISGKLLGLFTGKTSRVRKVN
jgi:hypothetical protein